MRRSARDYSVNIFPYMTLGLTPYTRIHDQSNLLFLCENLAFYVLRRILTSMINMLHSADQNALDERLQDVYDRLLLIKVSKIIRVKFRT